MPSRRLTAAHYCHHPTEPTDQVPLDHFPLRIDPTKSARASDIAAELIARIEAWKAVPPMVAPGYITPSFSWESE